MFCFVRKDVCQGLKRLDCTLSQTTMDALIHAPWYKSTMFTDVNPILEYFFDLRISSGIFTTWSCIHAVHVYTLVCFLSPFSNQGRFISSSWIDYCCMIFHHQSDWIGTLAGIGFRIFGQLEKWCSHSRDLLMAGTCRTLCVLGLNWARCSPVFRMDFVKFMMSYMRYMIKSITY